MREFRMPSLGADMDAGTLIEWMKRPGDALSKGDIIAVVETQKGAIEIEVFEGGVLDTTLVAPGEEVPVGHVLATIRDASEPPGTPRPAAAVRREPDAGHEPAATPSVKPVQAASPLPAVAGTRTKITPLARRLARERGIDPARFAPGPDGIVGHREVTQGVPQAARRPGGINAGEMRKAIASAMARSNRDIPHYYVSLEMDVSALMSWLTQRNATRPVDQRLLYVAPLLKAMALALRKFDNLNGFHENGTFAAAGEINIGVAVAMRKGGLITPAILGVDRLDVDSLMVKLNDLVRRVRGGGLRSSELSMGTVTLTNLGERTADALLPIIYPPQVGIVGCGQIRERPWVVEGQVCARPIIEVTVGGDHRVSDGRTGAQFLRHLEELLGKPEDL